MYMAAAEHDLNKLKLFAYAEFKLGQLDEWTPVNKFYIYCKCNT